MSEKQRTGTGKSGGMRIDDHAFFAGGPSKESPLPMKSAMKQYTSAEGAGSEMDYEDTSPKIKEMQDAGIAKAKAHPLKPNYRN
jgi:hypothetical protein